MNAPFIWGQGGQKLTPGQAKAMRDVASAIAAKKQTPQNLGEGLASVGDALLYNSNVARAGEAESAGQAQVAQALAEARASGGSDGFLDVMGNEWASPAQQMVAGELYKQSRPDWQTWDNGDDLYRWNQNDPNASPELWVDGAADAADAPSNVREWEYFNALSPEDQDAYLRMKRSIPYLDTGTGFVQPDPTNPGMAAGPAIVKDNYTEAYDKGAGGAAGKADEEARAGAPAAIASATNSIAQIDAVINDPNLGSAVGLGGILPAIPNTPQAGTIARIEQLQGAAFLQAFESLKGGGQITEVEGKKATDAIARLSRVQNKEDFTAALNDLKSVIQVGLDRAKSKLAAPQASGDIDDLLTKYGQ